MSFRPALLALAAGLVMVPCALAQRASAAQAQTVPGAASALAETGAPARIPAPVNYQEAKQIAVQAYPGDVLKSREGSDETQKWYEFDIKTKAGMMAYLRVDKATGNIIYVTYRNVKDVNTLPPPKVTEADASKIALEYVTKNSGVSSALGPAEVTGLKYQIHKNRPTYIVNAQQHMRRFTLYIDPYTGKVTDSEGRN